MWGTIKYCESSTQAVPFIIIKEQYLTYMQESEGAFSILEAFANVNSFTSAALLHVLRTLLFTVWAFSFQNCWQLQSHITHRIITFLQPQICNLIFCPEFIHWTDGLFPYKILLCSELKSSPKIEINLNLRWDYFMRWEGEEKKRERIPYTLCQPGIQISWHYIKLQCLCWLMVSKN